MQLRHSDFCKFCTDIISTHSGTSLRHDRAKGECLKIDECCLSMLLCPIVAGSRAAAVPSPIVIPRIRARLRPTVHEAAAPYSLGSLAGYATIGVSRMGVQWL